MIRLALTDLDETLIPYGQGRASDRSIAAIRRVNAIPGLVAGPISGRTIGMMSWMFEQSVADCFSTGICGNGQVVRLRGEVILRQAPSRETLDALADYLREVEGEGVALTLYDEEVEGREICVGTTVEQMARHPKAFHAFHLASEHVPDGLFVKTNIHCDRPRQHVEPLRLAGTSGLLTRTRLRRRSSKSRMRHPRVGCRRLCGNLRPYFRYEYYIDRSMYMYFTYMSGDSNLW